MRTADFMTEETAAPSESKKRRSGRAPVEESGGGKVLPLILVLIILGLAFVLYRRNGSAGEQAEADTKSLVTLSNQVSELRARLVTEQVNLGMAQSNLLAALSRRTAELMNVSNLVVQTRQRWEDKQQEATAAHSEVSAMSATVALLEAQRDELQRQAAVVPGLQNEVAVLKDKLNGVYAAQASLYDTLGRVRLEVADLERKLENPLFLHFQEMRVLEAAGIREQAAGQQPIHLSDPRVRLELQPDGTVRPAVAAGTQSRK